MTGGRQSTTVVSLNGGAFNRRKIYIERVKNGLIFFRILCDGDWKFITKIGEARSQIETFDAIPVT